MKILFVQEYFHPVITGGSEIYSYILVKELLRLGHEVFVIGGGFSNKFEIVEDIPIQRVNLMPSRFLFNLKSIPTIKKSLKKFKPDLIHGNTFHASIPAGLVGYYFKIPNLISVHNLFLYKWKTYFNPFISSLFYAFERIEFSVPYSKIIACDHFSLRNLKLLGLENKSVYIPYPIQTQEFRLKKRKQDKIVIGTAGRLYEKTKRLDIFMDLVRKLKDRKDVEFILIGPYKPSQEKFFKKFNNLKAMGKITHSKMFDYLKKIDIFIAQGIVAKEAMGCGCVTILNDVDDRLLTYHKPEIEEKVLLSGNIPKLVNNLIGNEKEREKIANKSINFIKDNYSPEIIVGKTLKVYNSITN